MFNRIRNIWKLGEYKVSEDVQTFGTTPDGTVLTSTGPLILERDLPLGDGKAEFLGEGTAEEFAEQERADKGLKGIFGL